MITPNLFVRTLEQTNTGCPPIWLMRQAGRYHQHYQGLRARYCFVELCKNPEVACETTMGPIRDFDFDAAILFSDLLFPLEVMGMGLEYKPGPQLSFRLETTADLRRLRGGRALVSGLEFQGEAMRRIRQALDPSKGLLGFVGGTLTLFYYAVEGSHRGALESAHRGLGDGRYAGFCERIEELLAANIVLQADGGADVVAILDTCAGELTPEEFAQYGLPSLRRIIDTVHRTRPDVRLLYYSKNTRAEHWRHLPLGKNTLNGIGVDWHSPLDVTLREFGERGVVQGNFDPHWLFLPTPEFTRRVKTVLDRVWELPPEMRRGWVCGLGHGVLPQTPERHVRLLVRLVREEFARRMGQTPP